MTGTDRPEDKLLRFRARKARNERARRVRNRLDALDRRKALFERKLEYDANSGCWLFSGSPNHSGYGKIQVLGRAVLAHRAAYLFWVGELSAEERLLHRCDTPACCNPDHLRIATQLENIADMVAKRRHRRGETKPNTALTDQMVLAIRADPRLQYVIARDYGVAKMVISNIKRRQTWKHLPDENNSRV